MMDLFVMSAGCATVGGLVGFGLVRFLFARTAARWPLPVLADGEDEL